MACTLRQRASDAPLEESLADDGLLAAWKLPCPGEHPSGVRSPVGQTFHEEKKEKRELPLRRINQQWGGDSSHFPRFLANQIPLNLQ